MTQVRALAYLRQLCDQGLGKEIVIAEFLRSIEWVIPAESYVFVRHESKFIGIYAILERTPPKMDIIIPEIMPDFLTQGRGLRYAMCFGHPSVATDAALPASTAYDPDFYHFLWPSHREHPLIQSQVVVNKRVAGTLFLCRPDSQKPFSDREQTLCSRLTLNLTHALKAHKKGDIQYGKSGASGMLIMEAKGTILYFSETARRLLTLACHPSSSFGETSRRASPMPTLAEIRLKLDAIFQGKAPGPPCWTFTNGFGRFIFNADWLDQKNSGTDNLIGLTIEHQEPLVLKLLRAMQALPLSPVQMEVALLLAQDVTSEKIGERLHIKQSTVKDHIGKIFTKLDIHHREALLPKLLELDNSKPIDSIR